MRKALKIWFITMQLFTTPVNTVVTKLWKIQVIRPSDFKITHGTLIIANHQSKLDPFLISHHVGAKRWKNILPLRYPVTPYYMKKVPLGIFIRLLGGYNIGENPLERLKKLYLTKELLKEGNTIVIFPEGKITRDTDTVSEFQKGSEKLFAENYPVVFVKLTGINQINPWKFWMDHSPKIEYSQYYDESYDPAQKLAAMQEFFQKN